MLNSRIAGVGHYLPERIVTNNEIAPGMGVDNAWIEERTGIRERRFAKAGDETPATMGAIAARIAIGRALRRPRLTSLGLPP